jgi:hypothetical protein
MSVNGGDAFTRYGMLQSTHMESRCLRPGLCVMPSDMHEGWLAGSLTRHLMQTWASKSSYARRGCARGPLPCHFNPVSTIALQLWRETKVLISWQMPRNSGRIESNRLCPPLQIMYTWTAAKMSTENPLHVDVQGDGRLVAAIGEGQISLEERASARLQAVEDVVSEWY